MSVSREKVFQAFLLSFKIASWAFFISLGLLVPAVSKLGASIGNTHAVPGKNETLLVESVLCSRRSNFILQAWCQDFEAWNFYANGVTCLGMFGLPYLFLVRFSFLQGFGLLVLVLAGYFLQVGFISGNRNGSIRQLYLFTFVSFSLLAPLYLKLVRPADCKLWKTATVGIFLSIVGTGVARSFVGLQSRGLLFSVVLLPLIRELIITPTRLWSKTLAMNDGIAGKRQGIRRKMAWCFMFIGQLFCATWIRMLVCSFADSGELVVYLVSSSVLELGARLTIAWRDRTLTKLFFKCCANGKADSHVMVAPLSMQRVVAVKDEDSKWINAEWMALVILLEMLAEFTGIFFNFFLIVAFRNNKAAMPIEFFAAEGDGSLTVPSPLRGLVLNMLAQVFSELFVDSAALIYEVCILEAPVMKTWKSLSFNIRFWGCLLCGFVGVGNALTMSRTSSFECEDMTELYVCNCTPSSASFYRKFCEYVDSNSTI